MQAALVTSDLRRAGCPSVMRWQPWPLRPVAVPVPGPEQVLDTLRHVQYLGTHPCDVIPVSLYSPPALLLHRRVVGRGGGGLRRGGGFLPYPTEQPASGVRRADPQQAEYGELRLPHHPRAVHSPDTRAHIPCSEVPRGKPQRGGGVGLGSPLSSPADVRGRG